MSDTTLDKPRYTSFRAFWPFYLREHSVPLNRYMHFAGTTGVLLLFILAILARKPLWLLGMPVFGYGWAWVGHFIVEKNRPATFQYPLWSLRGDFKMYGLMWRGNLWSGRIGQARSEAEGG